MPLGSPFSQDPTHRAQNPPLTEKQKARLEKALAFIRKKKQGPRTKKEEGSGNTHITQKDFFSIFAELYKEDVANKNDKKEQITSELLTSFLKENGILVVKEEQRVVRNGQSTTKVLRQPQPAQTNLFPQNNPPTGSNQYRPDRIGRSGDTPKDWE